MKFESKVINALHITLPCLVRDKEVWVSIRFPREDGINRANYTLNTVLDIKENCFLAKEKYCAISAF